MNNYLKYFGSPERVSMTLCDIELWFSRRSQGYLNDIPGDVSGTFSACLAELFDSGGNTIYGSQAALEWLMEETEGVEPVVGEVDG